MISSAQREGGIGHPTLDIFSMDELRASAGTEELICTTMDSQDGDSTRTRALT